MRTSFGKVAGLLWRSRKGGRQESGGACVEHTSSTSPPPATEADAPVDLTAMLGPAEEAAVAPGTTAPIMHRLCSIQLPERFCKWVARMLGIEYNLTGAGLNSGDTIFRLTLGPFTIVMAWENPQEAAHHAHHEHHTHNEHHHAHHHEHHRDDARASQEPDAEPAALAL